MAQSTISQRIALEGADDVTKQLTDLGAAGEKAIAQIQQASAGMGAGLSGLSGFSALAQSEFGKVSAALRPVAQDFAALAEAARGVGERIVEVASILGVGLVGGLAGGIAGIVELIKSSAEAGHQLEIQAGTVGLTVEQLQAYRKVAVEAGVDGDRVFTALVKLTQNLGKETEKLGQDTIKAFAALPAAGDMIGTSVVRGIAPLAGAVQRGVITPLGLSKEAVDDYVAQFANVAKEQGKALDPAVIDKFRQNVITLSGDVTKLGEDFRLSAATAGVKFPALTIGEELKRNAEIAKDPVLALGVTLKDLQANGENLDPVIRKIFDGIAAIEDPARKNAVALALLGRGAKELTEAFSGGSGSLDEALAKIKAGGLGLTTDQAKLLADAEKNLTRLGGAATGLRNQLAVIFAPALIDATKAFTDLIKTNADTFKSWATTIANEVLPGLANLIRQFGGVGEAAKGAAEVAREAAQGAAPQPGAAMAAVGATEPPGGIAPTQTGFESLRNTALSVAGTISAAFEGLRSVLTTVANLINGIFGTNFTAGGLAATVIVGSLTGVFTLLLPAITLVSAAIAVLATPIGAAIAIIVAITNAIINWRSTLDGLRGAFSAVVTGIEDDFGGLVAFINRVVGSIVSALQSVVDVAKSVGRGITSITGGGGPSASAPIPDAGGLGEDSGGISGGDFGAADFNSGATFASGGRVGAHPGAARGTDTVPAWLTPGEFVVRMPAVRHYGAELFHALNSMSLSFDMLRGFSLGGMVEAMANSFAPGPSPLMLAAGGAVMAAGGGPMNSLTLNLSGHSFTMDVAPGHVYDKLARHARSSAIRSAGRKPSWFSG